MKCPNLLFAVALAVVLFSIEAGGADRPNVLFAIADDWGWPHAGALGDRVVKTPTFDRIARESIELHGGIGFTWEFDLHLWFRRAIFDRSYLGDARYHRARAAALSGW